LNLDVSLTKEDYWNRRKEFIQINPASTLPVLVFSGEPIIGYYAITEFLMKNLRTST
jgi:glutathione S-transferase